MKKNILLLLIAFMAISMIFISCTKDESKPNIAVKYLFPERTLFKFQKDGKWGYINKSGDIKIEAKYTNVYDFLSGIAVVQSLTTSKYGAIDENEDKVIPYNYVILGSPSSDNLMTFYNNNKYGYINLTGDEVIENIYFYAKDFLNGLAPVSSNGIKFGYIDTKGVSVIDEKFDLAFNFNEGFAFVGKRNSDNSYTLGVINDKGEIVVPYTFENIFNSFLIFNEGLTPVKDPTTKLYGFINTKGEFKIKPTYDEANIFINGLAIVKKNGLYGMIDKSGVYKIKSQFKKLSFFNEGLAPASLDGELYGYINNEGVFEIADQYSDADIFISGLAYVIDASRKTYKYIDKNDKEIFKGILSNVKSISENNNVLNEQIKKYILSSK